MIVNKSAKDFAINVAPVFASEISIFLWKQTGAATACHCGNYGKDTDSHSFATGLACNSVKTHVQKKVMRKGVFA